MVASSLTRSTFTFLWTKRDRVKDLAAIFGCSIYFRTGLALNPLSFFAQLSNTPPAHLLGGVQSDQSSNERNRDERNASNGDRDLLLVRHLVRVAAEASEKNEAVRRSPTFRRSPRHLRSKEVFRLRLARQSFPLLVAQETEGPGLARRFGCGHGEARRKCIGGSQSDDGEKKEGKDGLHGQRHWFGGTEKEGPRCCVKDVDTATSKACVAVT